MSLKQFAIGVGALALTGLFAGAAIMVTDEPESLGRTEGSVNEQEKTSYTADEVQGLYDEFVRYDLKRMLDKQMSLEFISPDQAEQISAYAAGLADRLPSGIGKELWEARSSQYNNLTVRQENVFESYLSPTMKTVLDSYSQTFRGYSSPFNTDTMCMDNPEDAYQRHDVESIRCENGEVTYITFDEESGTVRIYNFEDEVVYFSASEYSAPENVIPFTDINQNQIELVRSIKSEVEAHAQQTLDDMVALWQDNWSQIVVELQAERPAAQVVAPAVPGPL